MVNVMASTPRLVLASTSRYRAELLGRLGLAFDAVAPQVDETPFANETPAQLARRLAEAKTAAVAALHPAAVVIGSDQVAVLDGEAIGKPGTAEAAHRQLRRASGREVAFLTAVTVAGPDSSGGGTTTERHHLDVTRVLFRPLDDEDIARYVEREQPLDCAGSFKVEGLGITLFERIEATDPTGLIGLPLIWLADALRRQGYRLP